MKNLFKILIIILLFFVKNYSQQWEMTNLPYVYNDMSLDLYFGNGDNGWFMVSYAGNDPLKIYKTTDKGLNWNPQSEIDDNVIYKYYNNGLYFINETTGWLSYGASATDNPASESFLYRTTNGGNSWQQINHITNGDKIYGTVRFINISTGYIFNSGYGSSKSILYKTTNGGTSWTEVYNTNNSNRTLHDIDFSKLNSNDVYLCGGTSDHLHPILVVSTNGFATYTVIANGTGGDEIGDIESISVTTGSNNQDILKFASWKGLGKLNSDYTFSIISHPINENADVRRVIFINESKGTAFVVYDQYYIYSTSDGGYNWNYSATLPTQNNFIYQFSNIGDIVSAPVSNNSGHHNLFIRKLDINFNTNYDWHTSTIGGTIWMDNKDGRGWNPYNTNGPNEYLRGGSCEISVPNETRYTVSGSDTSAQFYYWGGTNGNANLSLTPDNNQLYYTHDGDINADYKTSLKSTIPEALKDANQVKALKDTNGVTNLIYESMGGIFFTRTKPNEHYKLEEIVSWTSGTNDFYATFNNSNPYISEIKYNFSPTDQQKEENVLACWERREDNNIKICSRFRYETGQSPYFQWGVNENEVLYTITNAPEGFKCYPKIFYSRSLLHKVKVLTFLKPDGSNKKLIGIVTKDNNYTYPEVEIISSKNIQEYAIAAIPQFSYDDILLFNQYIAYRENTPLDQPIYFKRINIGCDFFQNRLKYDVIDNDNVVSIDNSRNRASIDIALRNASNDENSLNMQPVITYQGYRNTIVRTRDVWGNPQELNAVYYPIFARERLGDGSWNSYIFKYEQINMVQQNPIIEGSKQKNSFILNYAQNYTNHWQIVPRWNNGLPNTWYCSPNLFSGTDARLIKGALINNSSTSQKLMTLTHPDAAYLIEPKPFTITDNPIDPGVNAINGVIINDNIKYSFNLGDIMVNWNTINFYNNLDTAISDGSEFNENYTSKTFYLRDYDTLVISRNAFYVVDDPGAFHQYEYWVKLMNKSTSEMQTLLAHDTIQVGDTMQVEYLEGFIIDNIPGSADSFFVKMEVDTLVQGDDYGIGGGSGSGAGGDDINSIKRNVFWVGENIKFKNNNLPAVFNLYQNYPNPFNPVTKIKYDLPKNVNVTVKIYDLLGREVTTLINNEFTNAGRYELEWNAQNYASGVYIYRINAGEYVNTRKMILLK
jgi:hypothetical protein